MFTGYFSLGGNEVGNSARSLGYTRTAECPINWLRELECDGLQEALYHTDYDFSRIDEAPWYDPDNADESARFLGLYVIGVSGLSDSTRAAQVTEKNTDGAQVSGYRRASREVRVRAMLTARGMDALEYGMTWLRNVLEPNACGMHGNVDCGASDMGFFVDCPPVRPTVPTLSAWVESRRNLFPNPRATSSSSTYWGAPTLGAYSLVSSMPGSTITALRYTRSATGSTALRSISGAATPAAGATMHVHARIRPSTAITVSVMARPDVSTSTNQVQVGVDQVIAAGEVFDLDVTGPSFATAAGASSGVAFVFTQGAVSQTVDITEVVIEANPNFGFFDGATTNTTYQQTFWVGTAQASVSWMETRSLSDQPESDAAYNARVDTFRRHLHTVTCISGPLIQDEKKSADGMHLGYIVEFTLLAATPAVYGVTKEIELNPTSPTILQDTTFNLIKTPSATLAYGTVVGSTQYSTNPSVETNATGWTAATEIVSGSDPASYFSSARVTGELQAVGTSSFRGRILGNGSTAVSGRAYIWLRQSVALTGLPSATRMSFNIWGAIAIAAGASGSTINGVQATAVWRTGSTVLSTVTIGTGTTGDYGGKAYQLDSQLKPNAADNVLIQLRFDVTWASSATPANNSDIRAFADALAATVP